MEKSDILVLIVEDDASLRAALIASVKSFGYTPVEASKAEEALAAVKIRVPHAALIDCLLPKKNGVEVAVELRSTGFADRPIILMSGVFKDRNFEFEALQKTQAVAFFAKPFDVAKLKGVLAEHLGALTYKGELALNVLVSKPFTSKRERVKVIEALEHVTGFDLPFVISILLDSQVEGHLNIVNEAGEVFGLSLKQGYIVGVDSSGSLANLSLMMVEQGYLQSDDLAVLGELTSQGDFLESLVKRSYLSPHVIPQIRRAHLIYELKRLFQDHKISINFVAGPVKGEKGDVDWAVLIESFHDVLATEIPVVHLEKFYQSWFDYPITLGPSYSKENRVFQLPVIQSIESILEPLQDRPTLAELIMSKPKLKTEIYRGVHLLTLSRQIVFEDAKKVKSLEDHVRLIKKIKAEITGLNPVEVFKYFGAKEDTRADEVSKIYREFVRAHHPDKLPPEANDEIRKLFNGTFSIISEAHDVLTNETKRQKFVVNMKQQEAERQIRGEAMAEDALIKLRKGKLTEALQELEEALKMHVSQRTKLYLCWAKLKGRPSPEDLKSILRELDLVPSAERRNALYHHVMALLKKAQGDLAGAGAEFDKALFLDAEFLDSRRELSAMHSERHTKKTDSVFTGEISQIVSNLFRRKIK